jgi:signal transduction histidine kinase/CheY-like chemotaxis protein
MRRKIILALALLFTIISIGGIAASWYVSVATEELRNLVEMHEVEGLRRNLVISLQAVQSDLYTAHTALERNLDGIVSNVKTLDAAADECASCHHPPELETKLMEVMELIEEYKIALSHYITASANRERRIQLEIEAASIGEEILQRTSSMSKAASATLDEITTGAISKINKVRIVLFVMMALVTGLCIGVSSYLVRSITNPISRLVGATRTIAAGDFGHRVEDVKEVEFGELASHFNAMSAALEESYERLKSANENLQREINERKEIEKQSEELQAQLLHAQKLEALGTLSAGIAHEFGNSLQIIQSCVEILIANSGDGGTGQREIEMIGEAAQRGADLTRRILTFGSKVESRLFPIDLNKQVRRVKTILDRTLPETIEIQMSLADDLASVDGDPAQIEHVLLNLAVNSRDAMPDGGILRMETARHEADSRGREWVLLRVSDTGHGMNDETVQQAFNPFFTTKAVGAGTGLGLSMVYGIVKGHGGRVNCESEVGRGTSFEILLPGLPGRIAAVEAEETPAKAIRRGNEGLLLVDDEVFLLNVMRANLERHGYVIHTADSGERAVEFFEQHGHEVELVILDIGMPGMGGRACLEKLLEIDPDVKVIVSSGYGAQGEKEELLKAGANGFLPKPSQLSDILAEIDAVLSA